jgi:ABC-type proline/glycine betaine transport system ATPase subunit
VRAAVALSSLPQANPAKTTLADSDRILVLDDGTVAEIDAPRALLANHDSLFYQLCSKSSDWEELGQAAAAAQQDHSEG